ncbi:hypothetical protein [Microbispora sp. NPDC049125]|uniref:hypothetical protein n=1 Tax=Microbispora sp. NPDC049125 TaxID=3154929 RepID=UPI0034661B40
MDVQALRLARRLLRQPARALAYAQEAMTIAREAGNERWTGAASEAPFIIQIAFPGPLAPSSQPAGGAQLI